MDGLDNNASSIVDLKRQFQVGDFSIPFYIVLSFLVVIAALLACLLALLCYRRHRKAEHEDVPVASSACKVRSHVNTVYASE